MERSLQMTQERLRDTQKSKGFSNPTKTVGFLGGSNEMFLLQAGDVQLSCSFLRGSSFSTGNVG